MKEDNEFKDVTIIYYNDHSMELMHDFKCFSQSGEGRVFVPEEYKQGKSILVVCEGRINILNKLGGRITTASKVLQTG